MIGDNAHRVKQSIQIDLPNGQRTLAVNTVRDVYRIGDAVFGSTTIYGQSVLVRLISHIPQWRIVDAAGNYRRVEFPQAAAKFDAARARRRPSQEVASA